MDHKNDRVRMKSLIGNLTCKKVTLTPVGGKERVTRYNADHERTRSHADDTRWTTLRAFGSILIRKSR